MATKTVHPLAFGTTTGAANHQQPVQQQSSFRGWENLNLTLALNGVKPNLMLTEGRAWKANGSAMNDNLPASPWTDLRRVDLRQKTAIVTFTTDALEDPANVQIVRDTCEQHRVKLHHSTVKGNSVTLFLYLEDDEQEIVDIFGMKYNSGPVHKVVKRLCHIGMAQNSTLTARQMTETPNRIFVPISDYDEISVRTYDSEARGDGSGYITYEAAVRLCQASGMTKSKATKELKDKVAVQWFVSGTFPLKGLLLLRRDIRHNTENTPDVVLDAKNVKHEVSFKATGVKFNLIKHPAKEGPPITWNSYLTMGMAQLYLFGSEKVGDVAKAATQAALKHDIDQLKDTEKPTNNQEVNNFRFNSLRESAFPMEFLNDLLDETHNANPSVWNNPQNVKTEAGGLVRRLRTKQDSNDEIPLLLSGRNMILVYPGYAGVPYPDKGYAVIVRQKKQAWGIGFNPEDSPQIQQLADGADFDLDTVNVQLVSDEKGDWHVWGQRSPRSPGGGFLLRITTADAKALLKEGFIPYILKGTNLHSHVHDVDNDGNLVAGQYGLNPRDYPEDVHPKVHQEPWSDLEEQIEGVQERGIMGAICNIGFLIEHSNLFDESLSFLLSDVIDANGTATFMPMYNALVDKVIREGIVGTPLEACFRERTIKSIARRLLETGEPRTIEEAYRKARLFNWGHKPGCKKLQESTDKILKAAEAEINRVCNMANGPTELLSTDLKDLHPEAVQICKDAFLKRNAVWRDRPEPQPNLNAKARLAWESATYREARQKEAAIMQQAERDIAALGGDNRDLVQIYWRIAAAYEKRFPYRISPSPAKYSPLGHLVDQETAAAAMETFKTAVPTLLLRTDESRKISLDVGKRFRIARVNGQICLIR